MLVSAVINVLIRLNGTLASLQICAELFGLSASLVKTSICKPANSAFDAKNPSVILETSSVVAIKLFSN